MGISGMMHGYLAFDKDWNLLAPFRTWQNTMTGEAAEQLTAEFGFNIPQRWSIAHLYQAVLNGEAARQKYRPHHHACRLCPLSAHRAKTFSAWAKPPACSPSTAKRWTYDAAMLEKFDALLAKYGFAWTARSVLPKVLMAGQAAGQLTPGRENVP